MVWETISLKKIIFDLNNEVSGVYIPTLNTPCYYCTVEEYEQARAEGRIKNHYPIIHRYYQNGYCVNTDGIGQPLSEEGISTLHPYPCEYPPELIRECSLPLSIGLAGACFTTLLWYILGTRDNTIHFEKWIVVFSLSRKTWLCFRITTAVSKEEDELTTIVCKKFLLPPMPVVFMDTMWQGEKEFGGYGFISLVNDLIQKIKEIRPPRYASSAERAYWRARKKRIIKNLKERLKRYDYSDYNREEEQE